MDKDHHDLLSDPGGESDPITDCESSECFSPEKEQQKWACTVASEDLSTNGSWSHRSFSRSLQRAELLLRSTLTPSLKWLFQSRSQDEEEEKHFVVAHNLVSRSSARLLRLQQALLSVAPQWQLMDGTAGHSQACVKAPPGESSIPVLASSPFLQEQYSALCRLLQQRSMLLFVHEYSRRVRLAAAYISKLQLLQEHQMKMLVNHRPPSARVTLCSLSQELRVHLHHWPCLFSKVQSSPSLRASLVQFSVHLEQIQQTLDSLALQALVLMEHYIHAALCILAQSDLESVPREVVEDTLAGTAIYNQAVEELRTQRALFQQRTLVLQRAHHGRLHPHLPQSKKPPLSAFSVQELVAILAQHHAKHVAQQLQRYVSHDQCCPVRGRPWTWEQLLHTHRPSHQTLEPPILSYTPNLHSNRSPTFSRGLTSPVSGQRKDVPCGQCLACASQWGGQTGVQTCAPPQTVPPSSTCCPPPAPPPLGGLAHTDPCSVQLLFQVLVSSSDLLVPLVSHRPTPAEQTQPLPSLGPDLLLGRGDPPNVRPSVDDKQEESEVRAALTKGLEQGGTPQDPSEQGDSETPNSAERQTNGDPEGDVVQAGGSSGQPACARWHHSVQWVDLGQPLVLTDVLAQYGAQLWSWCGAALWLQLHCPQATNADTSLHLQDNHAAFLVLDQISAATEEGLLSNGSDTMLQDFSLSLLINAAHAQWDYELCRSLGSALKDKCPVNQRQSFGMTSSKRRGDNLLSSVTMEHFLLLPAPLLSSLSRQHADNRASPGGRGLFSSGLTLRRRSVGLVLAFLQMATVWVISKAHQFLSSWNLNKFLLITQGDLKLLKASMQTLVRHTDSLVLNVDSDRRSTFHNYNHLLLTQQLEALSQAVSALQSFSSLVLKSFSHDCKRMSGEIFKRTMPSAVHWRPGHRTALPHSPSEYASLAAQTVIGQVLEGVAPLPDDARVQALSITMTAFMEAWMEHILKQKIKFSVQGALQLKEDFDSIREMIQADRYGLSAELHQRLLSLRVFQQVDSAVVCLLQQPQVKPYLQSRTWESFTQCCPATSSTDSLDAAVSSSITNLRSVEGEQLTDPSAVTTELPPLDPSTSAEPYLAPSVALNAAQQQWLDLRIQNNGRRWRLPGLQCLSKSEP